MKGTKRATGWTFGFFLLMGLAIILLLTPAQAQAKTKVTLSKTSTTRVVGETSTIRLKNAQGTVTWSVENKKIVSIETKGNKCTLTAKKKGATTIYAKYNGKTYKCKVTVQKAKLNKTSTSVKTGKMVTIKLNGTTRSGKWSRSNKKITLTKQAKNEYVITGKTPGTSYVRVKVGNVTYQCKVTVNAQLATSISFKKTGEYVEVGDTYSQAVTIGPSNTYNKTVTYKSSNKSVATVDANGNVTAKSAGTVKITAKTKDGTKLKASYKLIVIDKITSSTVKFVAHRGLRSEAPDNTVRAFLMAAQEGFYSIETDIRLTSDGEFVCMHDANLSDYCGEDVEVSSLTYEEIRNIPLISGNNISYYTATGDTSATRIASLEEYLQVCANYGVVPMIELKVSMSEEKYLELYQLVTKYIGTGEVYYIGANWDNVQNLRTVIQNENNGNLPENTYFLKVSSVAVDASSVQTYLTYGMGLTIKYTTLTDDTRTAFLNNNLPLCVWTVNKYQNICDFIYKGVPMIATEEIWW